MRKKIGVQEQRILDFSKMDPNHTSREIATALGISTDRVRACLSQLRRKGIEPNIGQEGKVKLSNIKTKETMWLGEIQAKALECIQQYGYAGRLKTLKGMVSPACKLRMRPRPLGKKVLKWDSGGRRG